MSKILCATDGSKISGKAVDFALKLGKQLNQAVTILKVERVSRSTASHSPFWDSQILDAGEAITRAEFEADAKKAAAVGIDQVDYATVQGKNVAHAIVAYAEGHGCDHIVMGSHGHKGVQRLVLGSIAEAVVAEAHCPVTIVR